VGWREFPPAIFRAHGANNRQFRATTGVAPAAFNLREHFGSDTSLVLHVVPSDMSNNLE
jgi:hypothetical protein